MLLIHRQSQTNNLLKEKEKTKISQLLIGSKIFSQIEKKKTKNQSSIFQMSPAADNINISAKFRMFFLL